MRVIVATEARLFIDEDGRVRAPTQGRAYGFWTRYLGAFDEVGVLARVSTVPQEGGHLVEGSGVRVLPLTDFVGAKGIATGWARARAEVLAFLEEGPRDALVGRLPGVVGGLLLGAAYRRDRPYAVEVVGDPHTAVVSAGLLGRFSGALAHVGRTNLRKQVRRAGAVSYVTKETLQRVYPARAGAVVANYSSVELPDEAYRVRDDHSLGDPPTLIVVGTMSQSYKGHAVLLESMALLAADGHETRAVFVGDGKLRDSLEQLAGTLSLDVEFAGQLGSAVDVRTQLDRADLFVMPSLTEGLPRALIEAMARGLPAVGTTVGGIPELLEAECTVPPGDAVALAQVLRTHLTSPSAMAQSSARNFRVANEYHADKLAAARNSFYSEVRRQAGAHRSSMEDR